MKRGIPGFSILVLMIAVISIPANAMATPDSLAEVQPEAVVTAPPVMAVPVATIETAPAIPAPVAVPIPPVPVVEIAAPNVPEIAPTIAIPATISLQEPSILQNLGLQALAFVVPIAGTILATLAGLIMMIVKRRFGLDLSVAQNAAVNDAIRFAIAGAEEWAARQLKSGVKRSGPDKVAWVVEAMREKFPGDGRDWSRLIDQALGSTPGVGATGERAIGGGMIATLSTLDMAG